MSDIPRQRASSPERPRTRTYEGGWCIHHDLPTLTTGNHEWCKGCQQDLDDSLAVLDGAPDRRRA